MTIRRSCGPGTIGAEKFLDMSCVLKQRGKAFVAQRFMDAILKCPHKHLKTSEFRRAVRKLPEQDGDRLVSQLIAVPLKAMP